MRITERRSGDVVILEFFGRLVIGDDRQAREKIANLLAGGERKILIGMAGVSVLDSSGVGELLSAFSAAKSTGAWPSANFWRIVQIVFQGLSTSSALELTL